MKLPGAVIAIVLLTAGSAAQASDVSKTTKGLQQQTAIAQDQSAKSNASNLQSQAVMCFTDVETYVGCDKKLTAQKTKLPIGHKPGQVFLSKLSRTADTVTSISLAKSGRQYHTFTVTNSTTKTVYSCVPRNSGACPSSGLWMATFHAPK
jgi:hypothetical protein